MSKTITQSIKDESLTSLFQQLLGSDKPSVEIIRPKYKNIADCIGMIVKVLRSFNDDVFSVQFPDMTGESEKVKSFIERLEKPLFLYDEKKDDEKMVDDYIELKKSQEIALLLEMCKNLIQNKTTIMFLHVIFIEYADVLL